ncbi:MAG: tRNA threonylcarbamoyladenosine dehydratase [Thiobacillaceae bacterium]
MANLSNRHVLVAGLGGVGASCAEALARAGIGKMTLIDHDVVAVSNINRQLPALLSTVGKEKTELMADRIRDINPNCLLVLHKAFIVPENMEEYVPDSVDYVIDCIDSLNCKVSLLVYCRQHKIPVASSMGAGNKLDPSRIQLANISKTRVCALAAVMRKRLRRQKVYRGVLTVFSDEEDRPPRPPETVEGRGRPRAVNGTISYMPPLFGLMLAGAVINQLLEPKTESA